MNALESVKRAEQAMADALNDPRSTWSVPTYTVRLDGATHNEQTAEQVADLIYPNCGGYSLHEVREMVRAIRLGDRSALIGQAVITRRDWTR